MKRLLASLVLLSCSAALAEQPTEEQKTWALKRAYQLNGNSMVGWGAFDLSEEADKVVKTLPVIPSISPQIRLEENVCTRHGLRKIVSGRSWHCRKKGKAT